MPNFTKIGQTVLISIRYEQIYIYIYTLYIYIVLYILDILNFKSKKNFTRMSIKIILLGAIPAVKLPFIKSFFIKIKMFLFYIQHYTNSLEVLSAEPVVNLPFCKMFFMQIIFYSQYYKNKMIFLELYLL